MEVPTQARTAASESRTAASDAGGTIGASVPSKSGSGRLIGGVTLGGVDVSAVSVTALTEEAHPLPSDAQDNHSLSTISSPPEPLPTKAASDTQSARARVDPMETAEEGAAQTGHKIPQSSWADGEPPNKAAREGKRSSILTVASGVVAVGAS